MVVIVLEKCPLSLRGDLTKWLQEISLGVYVGHVSARVRDNLWIRVCSECKNGRATMVFTAHNEQHFESRVHNTLWDPIDFDGIKLMLRPSLTRQQEKSNGHIHVGSNLSKRRVSGYSHKGHQLSIPPAYVVVDIETTGLDPEQDEIVELAAVRVVNGKEDAYMHTFVQPRDWTGEESTNEEGMAITGRKPGKSIDSVMKEYLFFIGSLPLVFHNASFDMSFIDIALEDAGYDEIDNPQIDTLSLARKLLPSVGSYKLEDLTEMFGIEHGQPHRALSDCRATSELLVKLIEL